MLVVLKDVINTSMQQVVIEIALPRDRHTQAGSDVVLGPGIASLVGLKFLPEDADAKEVLAEKFHNIIDLKGFSTNFLNRHPDPNVHICEMRGLDGYDIEDIVDNREEIYNEIYNKYGNDTKIVFHIDEKRTQWKLFPHGSPMAKAFFEQNITMFGFVFEPNMGMIECDYNSASTRGFNRISAEHYVDIFKKYNIMPKEMLVYNCNHAVNRSEIRGVYEKYFSRFNITIMEPSSTFWYLTAAFDSNTPYFRESSLLQQKLDEIEQVYGNKDHVFNKSFNCLNNKPRTYRIQFLAHLDKQGLLDDTDWSLGYDPKNNFNWGDRRKLPMNFLTKYNDVLPKALEDDINTAGSHNGFLGVKTKLQEHGIHTVKMEMEGKDIPIDPFYTYHGLLGKTKFALVTETYGYHLVDESWSNEKLEQFMQSEITNEFPIWNFDRTLLSEKTFKMIASGIPAFPIDTRYTVEHFKELGFKFPWADMADYDHIRKFNKRSKKLASELHQFQNMDTSQFVDAIQHNLELFFDSKRIAEEMYKPFYKWLND